MLETSAIEVMIQADWLKHEYSKNQLENFIDWALSQIYYPDEARISDLFSSNQTKPLWFRSYGKEKKPDLPKQLLEKLKLDHSWMRRLTFRYDTSNDQVRKRFDKIGPPVNRDGLPLSGNRSGYTYSHVFSNATKNPFAYNAEWNLCRTPFFIDHLTGHESGKWKDKERFLGPFRKRVLKDYNRLIVNYDLKMIEILPSLFKALGSKEFEVGDFRFQMLVNYRPFLIKNWEAWFMALSGLRTEHPQLFGKETKKVLEFVSRWDYLPFEKTSELSDDWMKQNPNKMMSSPVKNKLRDNYTTSLLLAAMP